MKKILFVALALMCAISAYAADPEVTVKVNHRILVNSL